MHINEEQKSLNSRSQNLINLANQRVLVLDGAMGTAIQNLNLKPEDFGGHDLEGCNENLILTLPEAIEQIHCQYLEAGCDIIETNTFGATPLVLAEYGLEAHTFEINKRAGEIARSAAEKFSTPEQPRFVAGSIGPTTKSLSVTGGVSFADLVNSFRQQCLGLIAGGVDYFLIETAQDARNIKAALVGIESACNETNTHFPIAVSGTIETMGTTLAGQTVDALMASVLHKNLLYLGLNCATGPEFMTDHIRTLAKISPFRVACIPNAGLPDEDGIYLETPKMMGKILKHFMDQGWINFIGGCCGTTHEHIREFAQIAKNHPPRKCPELTKSVLSGIDYLEITDEMRPVLVGERTNIIGSKKFKTLIEEEKFEEAAEMARVQAKNGAQIIDICLSNPDRNELADLKKFMHYGVKVIRAPIMIDSTDENVIAEALTWCQGKAIINSVNLEDGEDRFEKVVPLARRFGAALVVGTIDEDPQQGMAITRQRKIEIAERCFDLLTKKYGMHPTDLYFDALVFPCASGDVNYLGSAIETIEGIRLIKAKFPMCKTVLGVSNVSFGLPMAAREVLNSVFLYHCVNAGLDLAIVNSEKLVRYNSLTPEELEKATNLLFNLGEDPIGKFAALFRDKKARTKVDVSTLPLDERLSKYIVDGTKEGLIADLDLARQTRLPLDIINGPLMKGMDEVGKLFNANKLIVAEVLQSAEVMKTAVSHLEKFMEKLESSTRGKILLATVKGDVHDIGKNLVDIILSNNGYQVINLGIKVPPERLIEASREHKPDLVGLSGLLVKSALQMAITAEDLKSAGIQVPILVGGAALSKNFTNKKILPKYDGLVLYASDAMMGLDLANQLMNPQEQPRLKEENKLLKEKSNQELGQDGGNTESEGSARFLETKLIRSPRVRQLVDVPTPTDFHRHVLKTSPIEQIWKYINPLMIYSRHLGIKPKTAKLMWEYERDHSVEKSIAAEDPRALDVFHAVQEVKRKCLEDDVLHPSAIYQFFKAIKSEDKILILDETEQNKIAEFHFLRQAKDPYLCLSDYVRTQKEGMDSIALFITSAGHKVRDAFLEYKNKGEFLKSHIVQALALESAEGYAEYLHSFLRSAWGFADSPQMTMMEKFQAKYQGKRFSFGYPACPRLEDQDILFKLLKPSDIGVTLTEGFMMDPEASVSAIVFHHPDAKYFGINNNSPDSDSIGDERP